VFIRVHLWFNLCMRRRRKILLWVAGCLAGAAVLGYFVLLPWVVRRAVMNGLRDAGVREPAFSLRHVSPFSTRITDLRAGGEASLEELSVFYTPGSLLAMRVREVRIDGLELQMDLREGKFYLGTLGDVLARQQAKPDATTRPATDTTLPLDRITLARCRLVVRTPDGEVVLPLAGLLTRQDDGRLRLQAEVATLPAAMKITGTIDLDRNENDLRITGDSLELSTVAKLIRHAIKESNLTMTGQTSVDVHFVAGAGGSKLIARLEPHDSLIRLPDSFEAATNVKLLKGVFTSETSWQDASKISVKITAENVDVRCKELDAELTDVSGAFVLMPLEGATQTLRVGEARLGQMRATQGTATVRVEAGNVLNIERTQWQWLDGTLTIENARITPGEAFDVTAVATGLDLKKVLETFAADHAQGEGKIDARLPMRIDWPRVGFARGSIRSNGAGRLMILKADELAGSIAPQLPKGKEDVQARTQREVIEALQDFDYDMLEANLVPEGSSLMANARLVGRGRRPPKRALDMQLRLRNVDDLLEVYLGINKRMGR